MKRIKDYKELFEIEKEIDLKQLKSRYRNLVKEWHPDKFQEGDAQRAEAEEKSRTIIDGYHFLVSIAPETLAANLDAYTETIQNSGIADYVHNGLVLEITFLDGSTYEYFGVRKPMYQKMVNSNTVNRFAKRSIYPKYTYRKSKRTPQEA